MAKRKTLMQEAGEPINGASGLVQEAVKNSKRGAPMNFHIEGRRWFQRTYGNTYHSVRIFTNSECIASLPYQYGYGDGYLQTALDWLRDHRPDLLPDKGFDEKGRKQFGTRYLREECHATYSCIDVSRQKDL